MEEKRISPIKAIRLKCLDCCCGSSNEVKLCPAESCPLHPFRYGKNPYRRKRKLTDEQRAASKSRLAAARLLKTVKKTENTLSEGVYTSDGKGG